MPDRGNSRNLLRLAIHPRCVSFLHSPLHFFQVSAFLISRAQQRVVLSTLYIGTGEKEKHLLSLLRDRLSFHRERRQTEATGWRQGCGQSRPVCPFQSPRQGADFLKSAGDLTRRGEDRAKTADGEEKETGEFVDREREWKEESTSSPDKHATRAREAEKEESSTRGWRGLCDEDVGRERGSKEEDLDAIDPQNHKKEKDGRRGRLRATRVGMREGEEETKEEEEEGGEEEEKKKRRDMEKNGRKESSGFEVTVLMDYLRGTRKERPKGEAAERDKTGPSSVEVVLSMLGGDHASHASLSPSSSSSLSSGSSTSASGNEVVSKAHEEKNKRAVCRQGVRVNLHCFYNPLASSSLLHACAPPRLNEVVGVQHMKFLVVDQTVLMTGANFSEEYFSQRQDRYVVVRDEPLADLLHALVLAVQGASFRVVRKNAKVEEARAHVSAKTTETTVTEKSAEEREKEEKNESEGGSGEEKRGRRGRTRREEEKEGDEDGVCFSSSLEKTKLFESLEKPSPPETRLAHGGEPPSKANPQRHPDVHPPSPQLPVVSSSSLFLPSSSSSTFPPFLYERRAKEKEKEEISCHRDVFAMVWDGCRGDSLSVSANPMTNPRLFRRQFSFLLNGFLQRCSDALFAKTSSRLGSSSPPRPLRDVDGIEEKSGDRKVRTLVPKGEGGPWRQPLVDGNVTTVESREGVGRLSVSEEGGAACATCCSASQGVCTLDIALQAGFADPPVNDLAQITDEILSQVSREKTENGRGERRRPRSLASMEHNEKKTILGRGPDECRDEDSTWNVYEENIDRGHSLPVPIVLASPYLHLPDRLLRLLRDKMNAWPWGERATAGVGVRQRDRKKPERSMNPVCEEGVSRVREHAQALKHGQTGGRDSVADTQEQTRKEGDRDNEEAEAKHEDAKEKEVKRVETVQGPIGKKGGGGGEEDPPSSVRHGKQTSEMPGMEEPAFWWEEVPGHSSDREKTQKITRGSSGRVSSVYTSEKEHVDKSAPSDEERVSQSFQRLLRKYGVIVVTAAPQANSFFRSKGLSAYIPEAYAYLALNVMRTLKATSEGGGANREHTEDAGRTTTPLSEPSMFSSRPEGVAPVFEFCRKGWTFHTKGIWLFAPQSSVLSAQGASPEHQTVLPSKTRGQDTRTTSTNEIREKRGSGPCDPARAEGSLVGEDGSGSVMEERLKLQDGSQHDASVTFKPFLTIFGSSNFSVRAEQRDLEIGFVLKINKDRELERQLMKDVEGVMRYSRTVKEDDVKKRFGLVVRLGMWWKAIRSLL